MDDKILRQNVIDQLDWEPSIDSADIGVAVEAGVVTLTGHVPTYLQKTTAEKVVKRVKGVRGIAEKLEVRYDGADPYDDNEVARRCLSVLDFSAAIPREAVQVKVQKGWVSLTGEVDWNYQRTNAEDAIRRLKGVMGITNMITVKPRVFASDVSKRIEDALKRDATFDAKGIKVTAIGGKVSLNGRVDCWHDKDLAARAAWSGPGVMAVENNLRIN